MVNERLLLKVARFRAANRLAIKGGLSRSGAVALIANVEDDMLLQHATEAVLVGEGDGRLLDRLKDFIEWLGSEEGQRAIEVLVNLILLIVKMFVSE
jgi:hypothetical protein